MVSGTTHYVGRFAPSPTGLLHAGSLVAAMASYLDAKAHQGRWLLRMEDVDVPRSVPGAAEAICASLRALGMDWDGEVLVQSQRSAIYADAMRQLAPHTYGCSCSRREIADSRLGLAPDGSAIYPGTCRHGLGLGKQARAWRLRVPAAGDIIQFADRWQGQIGQDLAQEAGDFVLLRADGFWAYQLAVVVDDAAQGVTHVVRGADLLDSTPRQIYLQRLLGVPTPSYLHVPVVTNVQGEKLSKQTGALALNMQAPLVMLHDAARLLDLPLAQTGSIAEFWQKAIPAWDQRLGAPPSNVATCCLEVLPVALGSGVVIAEIGASTAGS